MQPRVRGSSGRAGGDRRGDRGAGPRRAGRSLRSPTRGWCRPPRRRSRRRSSSGRRVRRCTRSRRWAPRCSPAASSPRSATPAGPRRTPEPTSPRSAPRPAPSSPLSLPTDGAVQVIVPSPDGRAIYIGGDFRSIGGIAARGIVRFDLTTNAIDRAFLPGLDGGVTDAAFVGSRLIIAGSVHASPASDQPCQRRRHGLHQPEARGEGRPERRDQGPQVRGEPSGHDLGGARQLHIRRRAAPHARRSGSI